MNQSEMVAVLEEREAVLHGHFVLSSGRHSDVFVQKFRVLEDPRLAQRLGAAIAESFDNDFDVVVAPAVGAVILGFTTALAGGSRFVFTERVEDAMTLRRGFKVEPHERALVVEDVITTGGSAAEVVEVVKSHGASVIGVGALIDRGDPARPADLGAPMRALVRLEVQSWSPDDCPMCARGEPVDDPGSRRLRSL